MTDEPEYRCPHCDAVLDHVVIIDRLPLTGGDVRKRHAVDAARLRAVLAAYHRGGYTRVMADLGVSKSQAFRLTAQARALQPDDQRNGDQDQ